MRFHIFSVSREGLKFNTEWYLKIVRTRQPLIIAKFCSCLFVVKFVSSFVHSFHVIILFCQFLFSRNMLLLMPIKNIYTFSVLSCHEIIPPCKFLLLKSRDQHLYCKFHPTTYLFFILTHETTFFCQCYHEIIFFCQFPLMR